MRAMAARLASRTRLDRAWGWLRAEVQRTWTAIRQKLTEKLGQAWGWLRAKARRLMGGNLADADRDDDPGHQHTGNSRPRHCYSPIDLCSPSARLPT